jgi:hypothetical protein
MKRYPLTQALPACNQDEISRTFEYMDEWKASVAAPLTLELLGQIFPQYSSGECEVIFNSWTIAQLLDSQDAID